MKVEPRGFVDRLDIRYERKRGVKDVMKIFGLNDWNYGIAIYCNGGKPWL